MMVSLMMNRFLILMLFILVCSDVLSASITKIKGVRMWSASDSTRLVIDLSGAVKHRLTRLSNPERVVIDVEQTLLAKPITDLDYRYSAISGIRSANKKQHKLRLVLDLKHAVHPKSFLLKPNTKYGYRLVIDLKKITNSSLLNTPKITKSVYSSKTRDLIVAIDAGHGGDDPGARGPRGTKEKQVVLAIARKLKTMVNRTRGMKAVMIRESDYYISLRGRTRKARRLNAHIFISIHPDAF
jgi:N-acetylmuramoyl-L-alanine amidase